MKKYYKVKVVNFCEECGNSSIGVLAAFEGEYLEYYDVECHGKAMIQKVLVFDLITPNR